MQSEGDPNASSSSILRIACLHAGLLKTSQLADEVPVDIEKLQLPKTPEAFDTMTVYCPATRFGICIAPFKHGTLFILPLTGPCHIKLKGPLALEIETPAMPFGAGLI